jgi:hypothetical protein
LKGKLWLGQRRYPAYIDSTGGNTFGTTMPQEIKAWFLHKHPESNISLAMI